MSVPKYMIIVVAAVTFPLQVKAGAPRTGRGSTSPTRATQLHKKIATLYMRGKFREALPLAKQALQIRQSVPSPHRADVAHSSSMLAALYNALGDYQSSLKYYDLALSVAEEVFVQPHPFMADLLNDIGLLHEVMGDNYRARLTCERSLAIREQWLSKHHPDQAGALYDMAVLHERPNSDMHVPSPCERTLHIARKGWGEAGSPIASSSLASIFRAKGDYMKATLHVEQLLKIKKRQLGESHREIGASLHRLARLQMAGGNHAEALRTYQESLTILRDHLGSEHPDVATCLSDRAGVYMARGLQKPALGDYKEALAIRERVLGDQHPLVAETAANIGMVHQRNRDYSRALPYHEKAMIIRERTFGAQHPKMTAWLSELALLYQMQGDHRNASVRYEQALAAQKRRQDVADADVAMATSRLAMLYQQKGDYQHALKLHEEALGIWEKALGPYDPGLVVPLDGLTAIYRAIGEHAQARAMCERSIAIREKSLSGRHSSLTTSLYTLAVLGTPMQERHTSSPCEQFTAIVTESQRVHAPVDSAASLYNLALLHQAKGDHPGALSLSKRAVIELEATRGKNDPDLALYLGRLASSYKAVGNHQDALPRLERALVLWEQLLGTQHPSLANVLVDLAESHWTLGNHAKFLLFMQRAMQIREAYMELVIVGQVARERHLLLAEYAFDLDRIMSFAIQHESWEAGQLAMSMVHTRKGRVLDSMTDIFAAMRRRASPLDRQLLDDYQTNRNQLAVEWLRDPKTISQQSRARKIASLQQEGERIERLIAERSAALHVPLYRTDLEQVRTVLSEGEVLVEFVKYRNSVPTAKGTTEVGEARYAAGIVRRTGTPVWVDLGAAAVIDSTLARWRQALAGRERIADTLARKIYNQVMAPLRAHLKDAREIFLAPDAALNLLPFAALVDEHNKYLVHRYLFTYVTSGRDLVRLRHQRGTRAETTRGVVVAAPQYGAPDESASHAFRALRNVMDEALTVQSVIRNASLLTGANASEAALKNLQSPFVLHLATHAYLGPVSCGDLADADLDPLLQSGLALAGANSCHSPRGEGGATFDDGLLTALEVATLDLYGTELVVLSACQTGVGETAIRDDFLNRLIGNGDGVYGLRRALVLAGAKTQVLSLWPVDDTATYELMVAFYRNLDRGMHRSQALREVQRTFSRFAHPGYWAGFIVSGESGPLEISKYNTCQGCCCRITSTSNEGSWSVLVLGFMAFTTIRMRTWRSTRRRIGKISRHAYELEPCSKEIQ